MDAVANFCKPSAHGMEAGKLETQGRPCLHSEFKVSLGYMKLCTKKLTPVKFMNETNIGRRANVMADIAKS